MAQAVVAAVLVVASLVLLVRVAGTAGDARVVRTRFAGSDPVDVTAATPGATVQLTGEVVPIGDAPVSEASGRAYVARDLRIQASSGDSAPARPARQAVDFLLRDGSGTALVRARGAVFSIERDHEMAPTTLDQAMWVDPILRASGSHQGSPTTCRVRLHEGVLGPGDRVGVVGVARLPDATEAELGAQVVVEAGEAGDEPVVLRPVAHPVGDPADPDPAAG